MQYADPIGHIVSIFWIAFIAVWIISAFTAKRTAKNASRLWMYRLFALAVIWIILNYFGLFVPFLHSYIDVPAIRIIGAVLTLAGIALAIWARFYLGRNWGMPMSEKAGAELVTTGPYAYIRHPIYAGVILASLGSALVFGALWAVLFVLYDAYFLYSAPIEDGIMLRLFPDQYPAYKARTKKLIPGVW